MSTWSLPPAPGLPLKARNNWIECARLKATVRIGDGEGADSTGRAAATGACVICCGRGGTVRQEFDRELRFGGYQHAVKAAARRRTPRKLRNAAPAKSGRPKKLLIRGVKERLKCRQSPHYERGHRAPEKSSQPPPQHHLCGVGIRQRRNDARPFGRRICDAGGDAAARRGKDAVCILAERSHTHQRGRANRLDQGKWASRRNPILRNVPRGARADSQMA